MGAWLRGYAAHLATYGGAVGFLILIFGLSDDALLYFESHQALASVALIVDFLLFSITQLAKREQRRIREFRRRVLSDERDYSNDGE